MKRWVSILEAAAVYFICEHQVLSMVVVVTQVWDSCSSGDLIALELRSSSYHLESRGRCLLWTQSCYFGAGSCYFFFLYTLTIDYLLIDIWLVPFIDDWFLLPTGPLVWQIFNLANDAREKHSFWTIKMCFNQEIDPKTVKYSQGSPNHLLNGNVYQLSDP